MVDVNYIECMDSQAISESNAPRGAYGLHSVTDIKRTGAAILLFAGYFSKNASSDRRASLAYRLEQSYPTEAAKRAFEGLAFMPFNEDVRNLTRLRNNHTNLEELKEGFGISPDNPIDIEFTADMSHGPHPINLIQYRLRQTQDQFDQYLFFHDPTGDDSSFLHLAEIEEILDSAEEEGFATKREALEHFKTRTKERYDWAKDSLRESLADCIAYPSAQISGELIRFIFGDRAKI